MRKLIIILIIFALHSCHSSDKEAVVFYQNQFSEQDSLFNALPKYVLKSNIPDSFKFYHSKYDNILYYTENYIQYEDELILDSLSNFNSRKIYDTLNVDGIFGRKNYYLEMTSYSHRNEKLNYFELIYFYDENYAKKYIGKNTIVGNINKTPNSDWYFKLSSNWYLFSDMTTNSLPTIKRIVPPIDKVIITKSDIITNFTKHPTGEMELSTFYNYPTTKREYKHGKWLYLNSDSLIIKEQIYKLDSLVSEIIYSDSLKKYNPNKGKVLFEMEIPSILY